MRDFRIASGAVAVAPWTTSVACAGLAVADVVLSAATPGYDFVGQTSSQLMSAGQPYSTVARVTLGLYGVLLAPFAIVLWRVFRGRLIARTVAVTGIWTHIVTALVAAVALNDSDDIVIGGLSANTLHDQAAMLMYVAAAFVLTAASPVQRSGGAARTRWTYEKPVRLLTWAALTLVLVSGTLFAFEVLTRLDGVMERVTASAFMVWMTAFAAIRRPSQGDQAASQGPGGPNGC